MKKLLAVLLSALITTACTAFGGDMIIRVSGRVPTDGSVDRARCQLGLVSVETGEHGITRDIPANFSTTMMVVAGPEPKLYYFVAECDGREFRSNEIKISSRRSHSREFDLGTLVEDPH